MDLDILQEDWLVQKIRQDDAYARKLYASMCNIRWQYQDLFPVLKDEFWTVSWRSAGAVVADIRGQGDYLDWYCSGNEGYVDEEVREDLARIGWHPYTYPDQDLV